MVCSRQSYRRRVRARARDLRERIRGWRARTRGWVDHFSPASPRPDPLPPSGADLALGCPLLDLKKRIRLTNVIALCASAIMAPWLALEALVGRAENLVIEAAFLGSFMTVLAVNRRGAHRVARLLLVAATNACVFAGALLFDGKTGGTLPFFALIALPLLLFGPADRRMVVLGALFPVLGYVACETGLAGRLLPVQPTAAPVWYFAANAASAFMIAFLIPFFFYRSNLKAEALLERTGNEKLHRVIDSNLIGVVRAKLSGRIEDANDSFLDMLGYERVDLVTGAVDLKALAPMDPFGTLDELRGQRGSSVYERTLRRKDGTTVPALVGIALLDESDDEVVGFVLDLMAQKRVESQRMMIRESQEALRLRDLFSSIASHELKTPLAALMLNLHVLRRRLAKEAPTNAVLRSQIDRCDSCAMRMGALIHALLDVAQMQDGHLKLSVQDMDVVEAVRRIASGFAVKRRIGLQRIEVRAEGPVSARLDALRFDQVLTNLLSNAVKYGGGKQVEVRVKHDDATDAAHLEVIDHGPGIPAGMGDKIFEPFQRAVAADEPIPGLGLGLYVVKMIVESHGGHINVESEAGEGTRFILDFPSTPALPSGCPPSPVAHGAAPH